MTLSDPADENETTAPGAEPHSIAQSLLREVTPEAPLRGSPRIDLSTEVDLSSESNFFTGFSTDLADGGLFLATLTLLAVGTRVSLKFTLPGHGELCATGEVRWSRVFDERAPLMLPGMGIRFVELAPHAKALISSFVAAREPMFFPD